MSSSRTVQLAFALLAVSFFAGPIALRVVGVGAEAFENRRFAQAPALSQGWDAFQQTSRFLVDRMPLRAQAVRLNTRIWTDVFGTDPLYGREGELARNQALPFAGAVEQDSLGLEVEQGGGYAVARSGRDGWLFESEEFTLACNGLPLPMLLRRWSGLVEALGASGRDALMFVVPYKGSVYREYVPTEYYRDPCAFQGKERLWRFLAREGPAVGVWELRSDLVRLKANAGDGLFQRKDSHWTTLGALALLRAMLEAVGGQVRLDPTEIVDRGRVEYTGDLTIAAGRPTVDYREEYAIERAPDAPRVPGRTLLLCDSFAYKWMRIFKPYFDDIRHVSWYEDESVIVRAVRESDRVIVEAGEVLLNTEATDGATVVELTHALRQRS